MNDEQAKSRLSNACSLLPRFAKMGLVGQTPKTSSVRNYAQSPRYIKVLLCICYEVMEIEKYIESELDI